MPWKSGKNLHCCRTCWGQLKNRLVRISSCKPAVNLQKPHFSDSISCAFVSAIAAEAAAVTVATCPEFELLLLVIWIHKGTLIKSSQDVLLCQQIKSSLESHIWTTLHSVVCIWCLQINVQVFPVFTVTIEWKELYVIFRKHQVHVLRQTHWLIF